MPDISLQGFSAQLRRGVSRPNLFEVVLNPNGGAGATVGTGAATATPIRSTGHCTRKLAFLCKGTQIPASTIGVIPVPFRGRQMKIAGDRTFADWTITVINDHDWVIRNQFDNWSNRINNTISNVSARGSSAPGSIGNYMTDGTINHLGRDGEITATYILKGCWPSEVAAIDLSYDSTDTVEEFTVTLSYHHWEIGAAQL